MITLLTFDTRSLWSARTELNHPGMHGHTRACPGRRKKMSKTSKTAKCPLPVRIRKRLEVTIDPENHEYLKNAGVNMSRLLDKAISELRNVTPHNMILISQKEEKLWAR